MPGCAAVVDIIMLFVDIVPAEANVAAQLMSVAVVMDLRLTNDMAVIPSFKR
jgi:hypothetical protein